jgi:predicted transglutaminase-like cysteine proteinase
MRDWLLAIAAVIVLALPSSAQTQSDILGVDTKPAKTPVGWVDFCLRYTTECDATPTVPRRMVFNEKLGSFLVKINDEVNRRVKPLDDTPHWGVPERWDFAEDGYGDCEDYVLLKRRALIAAGIPRQALLITVVIKKDGEGHAVLTVPTSMGDVVLDNLRSGIRVWRKTGYEFIKRQSGHNQNEWVRIGPIDQNPIVGN